MPLALAQPERAGADGQGQDCDRRQIAPVGNSRSQRRMENLLDARRGRKPRSRSAFVTTLTLLIAIAAAASTGLRRMPHRGQSSPIATGIRTTL